MRRMTELAFVGARELVRSIRKKELSSVEVTEYFLQRIERYNGPLNAVVTVDAEGARKAALAADSVSARGATLGPLHGLPMTVKDAFEVAGMRTTAGATVWRDHISQTDAVAIARMKGAGAIILGKTNTPAFCSDVQSYNPIFGTTNNPWDVTRTPGGSSGGSAAALAAGMTPLELGSDIAGSIRTPASFCGLFGHKPSFDLVPARGHMPGPPGVLSVPDLGVMGPLARSVDDLTLLLDVIAGPMPDRAKAYSLQLPAARSTSLRGYRVAAWIEDERCELDSAVLASLQAAIASLEQAGVRVERTKPSFALRDAYKVFRALLDPIMGMGLSGKVVGMLEAQAANSTADDPLSQFARNVLIRQRDVGVWLEMREQLRALWATFFEDFDVLLCPATPVPAIAHDHSQPQPARTLQINGKTRPYDELFVWSSLATCAHLPATVLPAGRAGALPIGIQVIGPFLEDRTCLDFAGRASEVWGGFRAPPSY
jgi:amidase